MLSNVEVIIGWGRWTRCQMCECARLLDSRLVYRMMEDVVIDEREIDELTSNLQSHHWRLNNSGPGCFHHVQLPGTCLHYCQPRSMLVSKHRCEYLGIIAVTTAAAVLAGYTKCTRLQICRHRSKNKIAQGRHFYWFVVEMAHQRHASTVPVGCERR
jgi:hypothetical protein